MLGVVRFVMGEHTPLRLPRVPMVFTPTPLGASPILISEPAAHRKVLRLDQSRAQPSGCMYIKYVTSLRTGVKFRISVPWLARAFALAGTRSLRLGHLVFYTLHHETVRHSEALFYFMK